MSTSKFPTTFGPQIGRRTLLKAGLAAGVMQVASPFIVKARGEEPIKIGLDDPFTGTYAELGRQRADRLPIRGRRDQQAKAASSAAR